jgi:hypothetical protein
VYIGFLNRRNDARRNHQYFALAKAQCLEQEISMYIKLLPKRIKQTMNCHAFKEYVVIENVHKLDGR